MLCNDDILVVLTIKNMESTGQCFVMLISQSCDIHDQKYELY